MNEFRIPDPCIDDQTDDQRIECVRTVLTTHGKEAAKALNACMEWRDTPCGDEYWTKVYKLLCRGERLPLVDAMYLRRLLAALEKRATNP